VRRSPKPKTATGAASADVRDTPTLAPYRREKPVPAGMGLAEAARLDLLPICTPRLPLPSGRGPCDDANVAVRGILQRKEHDKSLAGDREDWYALKAWWGGVVAVEEGRRR
jgi:hypothetical protein